MVANLSDILKPIRSPFKVSEQTVPQPVIGSRGNSRTYSLPRRETLSCSIRISSYKIDSKVGKRFVFGGEVCAPLPLVCGCASFVP